MIFMKVGDRQIELRKAVRHQGKYFQTKEGVFELDGEYAYEMAGRMCFFYNLFNSKPLSLRGVETVQRLYREKKAGQLVRELERINTAILSGPENKYVDPIHAMKELYTKRPEEIDQASQKWLIDQRIFDKDDLKLLNISKMNAKKITGGNSLKVPTIFPSLLMMVIGISIVLTMTQFNPLRWIGGS